jgi:antitoxin component of RelBE/YafQ-DinJ toxin-antitoxin module
MKNLYIPIDDQVKQKAQQVASQNGFRSLQEFLRVMAYQLAAGKLNLSITTNQNQPAEKISPEYEAQLLELLREHQQAIAKGDYISTSNVDEMMEFLEREEN